MKFWSQFVNKVKGFDEMSAGKKLKVIIPIVLVAVVLALYLVLNPIVLSISYDDNAYDQYVANRKSGVSFYTTESGTFYTTHGIHPFDIKVNYLLLPSEDLWEAFDNGNITIEDLEHLDFDYWFMPNDK